MLLKRYHENYSDLFKKIYGSFKGVYCTCEGLYPDPEDSIADSMIQYIICKDWFQGRHFGTSINVKYPDDHNSKIICRLSFKYHDDFLYAYSSYSVTKTDVEIKVETMVQDTFSGVGVLEKIYSGPKYLNS